MTHLVLLLVLIIAVVSGRRLKGCDEPCPTGNCMYENCKNTPDCVGGACEFKSCEDASCSGGACIFEKSIGGSCAGGGCTFKEPQETLAAGYCTGENCNLDGIPHPSMYDYMSA